FTCRNCGGGDRDRVAIYRPFGEVSLSLNCTVTCMVLKANDRRTSCPCHDEFRGPRSDYVRQIVRVHYFGRGGFVGHRSRASSKHLSPHLPVDGARFLGGQKGFCCTCKLHVWLSGLQRNRPDVDVFEK
ncbi:uncharacterized protein TNCV_2513501, partial [Trichonephila clavipes]